MTEALGWLSSGILLVTLAAQVFKQWRTRAVSGVSKWLFAGQTASQIGFIAYSYILGNMVFMLTNAALLLISIAGLFLTLKLRAEK